MVYCDVHYPESLTARDKEKFIGAGFFDEGNNSIAIILNIYHPDYAGESLGKYLMHKIEYARQQQNQYYYSGY